ncbi:ABC transporter substrate-binding protein [Marinobacter zhanjiangensis]|uniref:ABC transporter substrate-binding protein n=1 Tax=Marinobacter zhanjiangensis TaxID=578215 RepID=A0ABQ3AXG2_9GAMM|nr:ABC transporter substrate-binding protein [Marinobacter zhanjiangensis]GGY69844.1 ABC transporter substrate-binding protein [Marinobacter zhanjiangensis]
MSQTYLRQQTVFAASWPRLLVALPILTLLFWPCAGAAESSDSFAPRIGTVDWTLAETLLSLGVVPVGVAQTRDYQAWVGKPALPDEVVDLGLRAQPNRELIASLELDQFLLSPLYQTLEPTLSRMTRVTTLTTYRPEADLWQNLIDTTHEVARIAHRETRASKVVNEHRERIDQVRQQLPDNLPPMLVIQFIDSRHVRVYGKGSLYEMVMNRLGMDNAWTGSTNLWGYATIGIEELTAPGYLVLVDPIPIGVSDELDQNRLWQMLPAVRQQRLLRLPAVWSFGGLPSAVRFAESLGHALQTTPDTHASLKDS